MKRKSKFFGTVTVLCFVCILLFMQTADPALAASGTEQQSEAGFPITASGAYRPFEAAPSCKEAELAAAAMGKLIAVHQKSKLEQEAARPTIDPTKPMIALTFDDGPNGKVTERILNVLEQYNGRGTFFVVGQRVGSSSGPLLQRMAEKGHEIGNHSYSHKNFSKSGSSVIRSEIISNQNAISNALGAKYSGAVPRIARIPYGANGKNVGNAVAMPMIQWSVDTLDWKTKNAEKTVQSILNNAKDGDIILMHDLHEPTAAACEKVVPLLAERGFQLVTVSELFQAKGIALKPGVMYYKAR